MSSSWKGDDFPAPLDARKHIGRPSSGPPILDRREWTLAMPFVMKSHAVSRDPSVSGWPNGTLTVSPPPNSWNSADDSPYRRPQPQSAPSSFLGSADSHGHSPGHSFFSPLPNFIYGVYCVRATMTTTKSPSSESALKGWCQEGKRVMKK